MVLIVVIWNTDGNAEPPLARTGTEPVNRRILERGWGLVMTELPGHPGSLEAPASACDGTATGTDEAVPRLSTGQTSPVFNCLELSPGECACLCPGQGPQPVGMEAVLSCLTESCAAVLFSL